MRMQADRAFTHSPPLSRYATDHGALCVGAQRVQVWLACRRRSGDCLGRSLHVDAPLKAMVRLRGLLAAKTKSETLPRGHHCRRRIEPLCITPFIDITCPIPGLRRPRDWHLWAAAVMALASVGPRRPGPRDWENPAVVEINKRRSHVPLRSFTTPEQVFDHYRLHSGEFCCPLDPWMGGWRGSAAAPGAEGQVADGGGPVPPLASLHPA